MISQPRESILPKRFALVIFVVAATFLNLWLTARCVPSFDYPAISDVPAESSPQREHENRHLNHLPSVACFFMVDQRSVEKAVAVRFSNWAKRCSHFVIVSNDVLLGGEQSLDSNTLLLDINHLMQLEIQARVGAVKNNSTNFDDTSDYTTFPSPKDETKQYLTLKSFYSWMYMIRKYSDQVDYIMKADPDTYMLMDNYLKYLLEYYSPAQHAYIGRVFKTNGNDREPFVTGLSVTLSKTTAKLLLSKSTIKKDADKNPQCSAETFQHGGEADDVALAVCLSSMGVYPAYTRDEFGRERFMHFDPFFGNIDPPGWYKENSFTPHRPRSECCSKEACAFHYVDAGRQNDTLSWHDMFRVWHWSKRSD